MSAPDDVSALRMSMKKMQSMLHNLKMKISRVESSNATLIIWSLGFRIFLSRQWPSQEPRIQKHGV